MEINTLGIDLAKNVFQLHGVDKTGKIITDTGFFKPLEALI